MTATLLRYNYWISEHHRALHCSEYRMRLDAPAETTPERCPWCEREIGGG